MKLVTKIATIATLASFMFAGVGLTWGNTYSDDEGMISESSFGVHFDVNDNTTVGWENGLMVGLSGPAGSTFRLGMAEGAPSLGMSYTWWEGAGTGWATSLSTALDYGMTGSNDMDITVNLGFGF
jgi:hypothetical protein